MAAEKTVDVVENFDRVGAHGQARHGALQHGGEQGRAQAFAADVGDENGGAVVADGKDVKVIAADLGAGTVHAGDVQMRKVVQAVRNQRLLHGARDGKLLLQALALALPLDQARVVKNAGGLHGEGVENLAVDGRKGRDAPGIEINDAQQRPLLEVAAGNGYGAR